MDGTYSPTRMALRRVTGTFGWVLAVAVPTWLAVGRVLTGTAGAWSVVYALTLAPLLAALSVVALAVPRSRTARYPSGRACGFLWSAWGCGALLGVFLPEVGDGASSVLEAWWGPELSGVAAALSNPLGIAMVFMTITAAVLAVRDSSDRGRRRPADEDAYQGTGFYRVLGD